MLPVAATRSWRSIASISDSRTQSATSSRTSASCSEPTRRQIKRRSSLGRDSRIKAMSAGCRLLTNAESSASCCRCNRPSTKSERESFCSCRWTRFSTSSWRCNTSCTVASASCASSGSRRPTGVVASGVVWVMSRCRANVLFKLTCKARTTKGDQATSLTSA